MSLLYEVPVTVEYDEEYMDLYIKVYASSYAEAAEKAIEMVSTNIDIDADDSNIIKVDV